MGIMVFVNFFLGIYVDFSKKNMILQMQLNMYL